MLSSKPKSTSETQTMWKGRKSLLQFLLTTFLQISQQEATVSYVALSKAKQQRAQSLLPHWDLFRSASEQLTNLIYISNLGESPPSALSIGD